MAIEWTLVSPSKKRALDTGKIMLSVIEGDVILRVTPDGVPYSRGLDPDQAVRAAKWLKLYSGPGMFVVGDYVMDQREWDDWPCDELYDHECPREDN
jgi:hypothetical protein